MRDDLLTTLDNEISQFSAETNKTSLFMAPSPPQNHNPTLLSSVQFSGLDPDTLDSVMGGKYISIYYYLHINFIFYVYLFFHNYLILIVNQKLMTWKCLSAKPIIRINLNRMCSLNSKWNL